MGLSKSDREIWSRVTKNVTPLGQARVNVLGGRQLFQTSEPSNTQYQPTLDLHGLTVHEAFLLVRDHIDSGALLGYKVLMVISGKSGQINIEMPRWAEQHPAVRSIDSVNGGGAWKICLRKKGM